MESPTQGTKTTSNRTKKNKKRDGGKPMSEYMRLGFEESQEAQDLIEDMCECCGDAVQAHRARGYKVCMDCFVEMGV